MDSTNVVQGLLGGFMIGASAATVLLVLGRIAGISGIYGAVLGRDTADRSWRLTFLLGLLTGGAVLAIVFPHTLPTQYDIPTGHGMLLVSGLLVGIGTQLGGGCTSGHGVCGIGRFSPRSIVATITFMTAGMLTVMIARHVL